MAGGNARFLNAMVVWGDAAAVRAREHFDASVKAMLTALAPS